MTLIQAGALFLSVVWLSACGGAVHRFPLIEEVRSYNDGLRWNHYPKAAVHVHPKERSAFITERTELEEDLHISDYQIINVTYKDSKKNRAAIRIRYTWYLDSIGIVHKTNLDQSWRRYGKRWLLVEETRVSGEEMPGLNEPEDQPKDGDDDKRPDDKRPKDRGEEEIGDSPNPGDHSLKQPSQAKFLTGSEKREGQQRMRVLRAHFELR